MTDRAPLPPSPGFTDLRSRVLAGETLFGTFVGLGSPVAAELCARAGFDWVIIDLEHGAGNEADLLPSLLAVATTRAAALVRPQSGERIRIGRALDLGAHGVMIPRIDTPAQAREAVSSLRFPPDGVRGLALSTRGAGLSERRHADVRAVNDLVVGIIQIESRSAIEHVDEIASIDGADVLFVGPTDLSHSLGVPGEFDHRDYLGAIERTVAAARAHGKAAGILLYDMGQVRRHLEMGFGFIGLGADGGFVAQGARAALQAGRLALGASRN